MKILKNWRTLARLKQIVALLKDCDIEHSFAVLSREENLEWVDNIPSIPTDCYTKYWKLITEILINNSVAEIELLIGFSKHYPYKLPDIYFLDNQYDYIPHIDCLTRKLCYIEDGVSYNTVDSTDVLRDCIHRAKRLIEDGVNKRNVNDFVSEINSYWSEKYSNESALFQNIVMFGTFPTKSSLIDLFSYKEDTTNIATISRHVLIKQKDDSAFSEHIRLKRNVTKRYALYIKSLEIKEQPPYSLSIKQIVGCIQDENDIKLLKLHLNKDRSLIIVFRLFDSDRFGGVVIPKQPTQRNGFSNSLSAYDELIKFEKQNQPLRRIIGEVYSSEIKLKRGIEDTSSMLGFTIIGLGSIGSNLCYYLMGYSNSVFTLIDNDVLHSENTGRHLLGFRYVGQAKSFALQDYIKEKYPEITVNAYAENIFDNFEKRLQEINSSSALFVCVGDSMVEEFLIDNVQNAKITTPLFILWLEPFSIAGHMIYINPQKTEAPICLIQGRLKLYKHNLIHPGMYEKRSDEFVERDAGCNGTYALYNQNNVTLFLSAIYLIIDELIKKPSNSKCYRWTGNIDIANQKGIPLTDSSVVKGSISELPI